MSTRLEQLKTLWTSNPNDEFIIYAIAKEYESLGNDDDALRFYTQLIDNSPNYVGTYYHLGKLFERMNDFENAVETYKKGMEIAKKIGDRHALSELAGAKLNLVDDEEEE